MKKNEEMWLHTQSPTRFPEFTVVVVTFFVEILDDFHDFVSECVSFWESHRFFKRKVTISIGRETKHTLYRRKSTKKSPKIHTEDVPMRAALRATQLAEQLVEVPTIIPFSLGSLLQSLLDYKQRTVEQNVDIPAVGGSGTGGGPSGFLPEQSYSMTAEQIVEIPVPRPDGAGDLQGFPRRQGSTALSGQIPEFPDPVGGHQDFQPVQGSAASSSDLPGQAGQGVFRTSLQNKKKCKVPAHPGVGTASAIEPMDAGAL